MSNGIFTFYLIALIPSIVGCFLFMLNRRVNWQEWLFGTALAFLVSAIMHGFAIYGMTDDIQTLSGSITHICHFPAWTERYTEHHSETTTDSKGNTHTRTWTTTEYDHHSEYWSAFLSFGKVAEEKNISQSKYEEIKKNFGGVIEDGGRQAYHHGGTCTSGDNNIYLTQNKTKYLYPVTTISHFENKIKASPTLFSFCKVPDTIKVYEWPQNPNCMVSDRLIGESRISILEFDRMNSRIGPYKRANVLMINFGDKDSSIAQYEQAKLCGGKKNDLVLCYGQVGTNGIPAWSMVFGWTEQEICKRNIETIILSHPINNDILPLIENEVKRTYVIKDWTKWDYVSVEPRPMYYMILIILMILTQVGFWIWAGCNEFTKDGSLSLYRYRSPWV